MRKLAKRDRRILMIGGVSAVVILVFFYILLPFYESMAEIDQELARKEELLKRSVAAIRNQNLYRQQLLDLDNSFAALEAQILEATNATVAQAELENTVRQLAEEYGVDISRSTPLQTRSVGKYSKVTVQINVDGGLGELSGFLHALSVHPKFFEVDNFTINGFRIRDRIRLQPRMHISAYVQLEEG